MKEISIKYQLKLQTHPNERAIEILTQPKYHFNSKLCNRNPKKIRVCGTLRDCGTLSELMDIGQE